jgi:hypothetical protein
MDQYGKALMILCGGAGGPGDLSRREPAYYRVERDALP